MIKNLYQELPEFSAILTFVDAIFAEINIGLLIYHVPDRDEISGARLIYANKQASICTGTDLGERVGMQIFEAFPTLENTDVSRAFASVVATRQPRKVGVVEYGDHDVRQARYETRAFPMPHSCLGVIFENISN
jgi:hypothetical protein